MNFDDAFGKVIGSEGAYTNDPHDPGGPSQAFLENWLARTCELVDTYQPQLIWFDWWIEHIAFEPYLRRFAAYY